MIISEERQKLLQKRQSKLPQNSSEAGIEDDFEEHTSISD